MHSTNWQSNTAHVIGQQAGPARAVGDTAAGQEAAAWLRMPPQRPAAACSRQRKRVTHLGVSTWRRSGTSRTSLAPGAAMRRGMATARVVACAVPAEGLPAARLLQRFGRPPAPASIQTAPNHAAAPTGRGGSIDRGAGQIPAAPLRNALLVIAVERGATRTARFVPLPIRVGQRPALLLSCCDCILRPVRDDGWQFRWQCRCTTGLVNRLVVNSYDAVFLKGLKHRSLRRKPPQRDHRCPGRVVGLQAPLY